MPRRKASVIAHPVKVPPSLLGPESGLTHQSPYSNEPWKPGQIPRKDGFSQIPVIQPSVEGRGGGKFMSVKKPTARGDGKPSDETGDL